MANKVYDLLILGAGPAGITASVYAVRKKIDFLVITRDIGGQTTWSGDIENYTGYQFITGPQLTRKFQDHMDSYGITVKMPQAVTAIGYNDAMFTVTTDEAEYLSRTLIIATGKQPRRLGVPGEEEFRNRGVTYCATCDGPVFKDKPVAIIGGGNSALDAALQMMKISPQVYLINNTATLHGDAVMIEKVENAKNIEIRNNTRIKNIQGEKFVKKIVIGQESRETSLDVEGVFIEIGLTPNSGFTDIVRKNEHGEIIVDCHNQTNIQGLFAAGDVTNVPEKQIIIAAGEGAKAALSAFRHLNLNTFEYL
ncbi:MAG: FAD-dependent oxidoreductase [Candidatus Omnitrophica bacterium]|nr:FAD-dependent oxidoreductase [Candidatus Omnitrophota bacterium]